jgi:hypothetical protein
MIAANPDVGLFHELTHARHIQQGTVVDDEREMERRVIGIGKYTNAKGTENHYRETRGLPRRCCWEKETLEGLDTPYFPLPLPDIRAPIYRSFGQPASTGEFSETEREMVAREVIKGGRNVNQLSDRLFFARHPDRTGKLIDPKLEPNLAKEWKNIKGRLVLPILEALDLNEKGKQAMYANQVSRAIGFFDRARRVSIAPAQIRARATFNLGLASLLLKRFAAAIGYFEVVRTFPGISEELRAKAEERFAQAKQEYSKAVP